MKESAEIAHPQVLDEPDVREPDLNRTRTPWDRIGVMGSALCIVHCLSVPVILGYTSVSGLGFFGNEIIHQVLAVVLLAVAALAFVPAYRHHRHKGVLAAGGAGVALILFTAYGAEPLHLPDFFEVGLTIMGSLLLVGAHLVNQRLNHQNCCPPAA